MEIEGEVQKNLHGLNQKINENESEIEPPFSNISDPKLPENAENEENVITSLYLSAKLKEFLVASTESVGRNYRTELKKIILCFTQFILTIANQISLEEKSREITKKHVEMALKEANFEHFKEQINEQIKSKFYGKINKARSIANK